MNDQSRNPVATLKNRKSELYITDFPAMLGRNDNSVDIYFFHESISREHCLFEYINRRVTIRDLGSTVGTFVDGVKLEPNVPYIIENGAQLTIGKVKFVLNLDYDELARRERSQFSGSTDTPWQAAGNDADCFGMESGSSTGNSTAGSKVVTVKARELTEYEYGEDEVVFIECGFEAPAKPLSFTNRISKKDIELAFNAESDNGNDSNDFEENEIRKTQVISVEDIPESTDHITSDTVDPVEEDDEETVSLVTKALYISWLDVVSGENKKFIVDHFPFYIGRKSDENDYSIRRRGISRKHMHFEEADGEYFVIDDNSTNGVKLNGNKIDPGSRTKIRTGDKIDIADVTLTIRTDR